MIIGGIDIFLPRNPTEARESAGEGRNPIDYFILEDIRRRKEEHLVELFINCSKGDEQRTTTKLELEAGERAIDNMDFVDLCEDLKALEKRVMMETQPIQQVKLELDE